MHKYMKIGKRNGKRKKKRDFPANWAGGGGGGKFSPAGARARPRDRRPSLARQWGQRRPTRQREEGVTASGGGGEAVRGDENRSPVKFRDGSSPVVRFCIDGMVARHERR
jgi:hypothetical protein